MHISMISKMETLYLSKKSKKILEVKYISRRLKAFLKTNDRLKKLNLIKKVSLKFLKMIKNLIMMFS